MTGADGHVRESKSFKCTISACDTKQNILHVILCLMSYHVRGDKQSMIYTYSYAQYQPCFLFYVPRAAGEFNKMSPLTLNIIDNNNSTVLLVQV